MSAQQTAGATPRQTVPRWRAYAAGISTFAILFAWTVLLQWGAGAYRSEFSGYPDEPAHYVSGLMVRDYLMAGLPRNPLAFAENYYLHYPKVAIGMWGPLLHLSEGVWMCLFTSSRTSILLMMALITAALAFTLSRVLRAEFGWGAGAAVVVPGTAASTESSRSWPDHAGWVAENRAGDREAKMVRPSNRTLP